MAETIPFRIEDSREPARVVRGRVTLPSSGERTSPPWPCAILLHGFKGFMDWGFFPELARRIARRGMAPVSFNFSGSGIGEDLESFTEDEAFARDTFTRQLEDLERVRAFLAGGGFERLDLSRLGLFGHSRGGGIALLHASERSDYRALVTWAAIPSVDRFDQATKDLWRRQGYLLIPNARLKRDHRLDLDALLDLERNRERLDIVAACARVSAPVLLVHGSADESVEPEAVDILSRALPAGRCRKLVIEGAGHTFGASHPLRAVPPELALGMDASVDWLAEHLLRGSPTPRRPGRTASS